MRTQPSVQLGMSRRRPPSPISELVMREPTAADVASATILENQGRLGRNIAIIRDQVAALRKAITGTSEPKSLGDIPAAKTTHCGSIAEENLLQLGQTEGILELLAEVSARMGIPAIAGADRKGTVN